MNCQLSSFGGPPHRCSADACPFWEPGGAVLDGRCAIEHLDLETWPDLVPQLRSLRDELTRLQPDEQLGTWHRFHRLLNQSGTE